MKKHYKQVKENVKSKVKAKLRITLVALFLIGLAYGILVGKYQFPPYKMLSNMKSLAKLNFDISVFEYFESITPKGKNKSVKIIQKQNKIRDNAAIIKPVLNKILPIVYDSQKTSPDFKVKLPSILGYTINFSVSQGENISFFIHNKYKVRIDVFRLGRSKFFLESMGSIERFIQPSKFSPAKGFDWSPSLNINTKDLKPGYYLIELVSEKNSSSYQIPFIVKSKNAKKISFVAGTNTWNAYNNYAGKSFYEDTQTIERVKEFNESLSLLLSFNGAPTLPVHIPFARPYAGQAAITDLRPEDPHFSHLIRGEWTLLAFAEEHSLDYGIFTDRDIFKGSKVFDADIVVFNCHSEYWSKEMLAALNEYITNGGKVVFSGGNNIYQKIRYNQYGMELIEPYTAKDISPIIGTFFSKPASPMFSSYQVKNNEHWIFRGTGLKNGDEFGKFSLNHRPEENNNGASGWEADQTNKFSYDFLILASGTNKFGGAQMVFKDTGNGGWIFNASSIPFTGALFNDKVVAKIMLNLLEDNESKH